MPYVETSQHHSIATAMRALLSGYDGSSPRYQKYQERCLERMCRFLEHFITPLVSEEAARKAVEIGISVEALRAADWADQRKFDPDRSIFHFEHVEPTTQLANRVIEARNESVETIVTILQSAEIAWITKGEDKELTKKGFRKRRRDPLAAYETCRIKFVEIDS